MLAEAYRDAERQRGEGDAQATDIYAQAYGKNQDFYSFHRSLSAYRQSFDARMTCWCCSRIPSSSAISTSRKLAKRRAAHSAIQPSAATTQPSPSEAPPPAQ